MDWQASATLWATALEAIDKVVTKANGMKSSDGKMQYAADAITVIGAILETVAGGGNVADFDPESARRELASLLLAISDNDAVADKAVVEKFGLPGKD